MPYHVVKSGSGYKVHNKRTGKTYSKRPLSRERAEAQMRAMYANSSGESIAPNPLAMKIDEALRQNNIHHGLVNIDPFTRSYMQTALWSTTGDDGQPLDEKYNIDDISDETKAEMIADCTDFQEMAAEHLLQTGDDEAVYVKAGKDFWLTRNGHGAGFWDGDWQGEAGSILTKMAKSFGGVDLYVGDDGKIYH